MAEGGFFLHHVTMKALVKEQQTESVSLAKALGLSAQYSSDIKRLLQYCDDTGQELSVSAFCESAQAMQQAVRQNEVSAATFNRYLYAGRRFVSAWLKHKGANAAHIAQAVDAMKAVKRIQVADKVGENETLTADEIDHVKAESGEKTELLIELLQVTGLRVTEAINLPARLDLIEGEKNSFSATVTGKGGKQRLVYLPVELVEKIRSVFQGNKYLLETRTGKRYARQNIYTLIERAGLKASKRVKRSIAVSNIHPHTLRHSWATNALNSGVDIHTVSQHLGHASIETTARYYLHRQPKPEAVLSVY